MKESRCMLIVSESRRVVRVGMRGTWITHSGDLMSKDTWVLSRYQRWLRYSFEHRCASDVH